MPSAVPGDVHVSTGWEVVCWLLFVWMCAGMAISHAMRIRAAFSAAGLVCGLVLISNLPTGDKVTAWSRTQAIVAMALYLASFLFGVLKHRQES